MSPINYKNFRNETIENLSAWRNLTWRQKIEEFRSHVKDNVLSILENNKNLSMNDFKFLRNKAEIMKIPKIIIQEEWRNQLVSILLKANDSSWMDCEGKLSKETIKYFKSNPLAPELSTRLKKLISDWVDMEFMYDIALANRNSEKKAKVMTMAKRWKSKVTNPEEAFERFSEILDDFDKSFSSSKLATKFKRELENDMKKRMEKIWETEQMVEDIFTFFRPDPKTANVQKVVFMPTDPLFWNNSWIWCMFFPEFIIKSSVDNFSNQEHEFLHWIINPIVDNFSLILSENQKSKIAELANIKLQKDYWKDYYCLLCEEVIRTYNDNFNKWKKPLKFEDFEKNIFSIDDKIFQKYLEQNEAPAKWCAEKWIKSITDLRNDLREFYEKFERNKLREIIFRLYEDYSKQSDKEKVNFEQFLLKNFVKYLESSISENTNKETENIYNKIAESYDEDSETQAFFALEKLIVLEMLSLSKWEKVLDLGCWTGKYISIFPGDAEIYWSDISEEMINQSKKKNSQKQVKYEVSDITKWLPFRGWFFDKINCSQVLKFITSQKELEFAFKEIKRILKKWWVFVFTNNHPERNFEWNDYELKNNNTNSDNGNEDVSIPMKLHSIENYKKACEHAWLEIEKIHDVTIDENLENLLTKESFKKVNWRKIIIAMKIRNKNSNQEFDRPEHWEFVPKIWEDGLYIAPSEKENKFMIERLREVWSLMYNVDFDWTIDGAFNISIYNNRFIRNHKDVDLWVFEKDLHKMKKHLQSKWYDIFLNLEWKKMVEFIPRWYKDDYSHLSICKINDLLEIQPNSSVINYSDLHVYIENKDWDTVLNWGFIIPKEYTWNKTTEFNWIKWLNLGHPVAIACHKFRSWRDYDYLDLKYLLPYFWKNDLKATKKIFLNEIENKYTQIEVIFKQIWLNIEWRLPLNKEQIIEICLENSVLSKLKDSKDLLKNLNIIGDYISINSTITFEDLMFKIKESIILPSYKPKLDFIDKLILKK